MDHPYKKLESINLWTVVEEALEELRQNQDIEIITRAEYVIGFLCEKILKRWNHCLAN